MSWTKAIINDFQSRMYDCAKQLSNMESQYYLPISIFYTLRSSHRCFTTLCRSEMTRDQIIDQLTKSTWDDVRYSLWDDFDDFKSFMDRQPEIPIEDSNVHVLLLNEVDCSVVDCGFWPAWVYSHCKALGCFGLPEDCQYVPVATYLNTISYV